MLEGKVRFAKVNCDNYQQLCKQADVRAYPTVKLYWMKQHRQSLSNGIRLEGSNAETIRDEVLTLIKKKRNQDHDEL